MWGLLHVKPSLVSHGWHVLGIAGLQPGHPSTAAGLPTEKETKLLKGDDMFDVRRFFVMHISWVCRTCLCFSRVWCVAMHRNFKHMKCVPTEIRG